MLSNPIVLSVICFLLGALPFGLIISKFYGVDVRAHGSGNIGATNVARTLGKKAGLVTLLLDTAKGALAVWLCRFFLSDSQLVPFISILTIFGHCFSPFLLGKGGKGVATALGVALVLVPYPMMISLVIFILIVATTGYVALGSIVSTLLVTILTLIIEPYTISLISALVVVAILITARHQQNIKRMWRGQEPKFGKTISSNLPS